MKVETAPRLPELTHERRGNHVVAATEQEQAKPFSITVLQQRPESAGRCALGIRRKVDTPQWQVARAEIV
ncbi:MAG: hypothetical protein WCE36_26285, partial [Pseudolabrys sp.]